MPLGIYIQVPFCQTKCTYCNFHTGVVSRERYQPYAEAVCREIFEFAPSRSSISEKRWSESGRRKPEFAPADTIYFGGGTPSLLEPSALARILNAVESRFGFGTAESSSPGEGVEGSKAPEITLEADPETVTAEKAAAWRAARFSRISLGVQSFNDSELQAAGRLHRRVDAIAAAQILRASGFANISMDLIAGLPRQTRASWADSLTQLAEIRPAHVSIYMLEIDEGSRLGREFLSGGARYSASAVPSDDDIAGFYESACVSLSRAGYEHYEISNWALPGYRSRHNLKYWQREPYIGFGAGAHSFDGSARWANTHDSARYASLVERGISPREQVEEVTAAQALDEEFFLGLRQLEGIDFARIERKYASQLDKRLGNLRAQIEGLQSLGLLDVNGSRLRLAPDRLSVANEVFVDLLG